MDELYLKQYWLEFTYNTLEKLHNDWEIIIMKYRDCYEIRTYPWKNNNIEYWLHHIRQLRKNDWAPYTKRGRHFAFTPKQANEILHKDFFIC